MPCSNLSSFNPSTDIPDLSGKVILITGGTAGLGTETILQLSKHNPSRILFTGRNTTAANKVIETTKAINANLDIRFIPCDFTPLKSVQEAGKHVVATNERLDILMCNAGVMAVPKVVTKDGYEVQFGINHVAHASLIKTLLPLLLEAGQKPDSDVRIVSNSSLGFTFATTIDFDKLHSENDLGALGAFKRYGQSKLANILYTRQLAKHYPSITSVAIHPGIITTGLMTGMSSFNKHFVDVTTIGRRIDIEDGAKNQLWCATMGKEGLRNGGFYEPVGRWEGGRTRRRMRVLGMNRGSGRRGS
ncbi:oxidoreductase [Zopfia rhizophila CBS 207.26]|uniref:Oxidoreductase n=1 Tax=Zopfia rhizophila CBS 207.26 TaxID=1314779 RepID=A0A6A6EKV5_9PEZI|nr:oxidoreductase [Zopfia rhizophila CBS 207.26]